MSYPQKANIEQLNVDIQNFIRRLRLAEYFNGRKQKNDETIVKNKIDFIPDRSNDENLEKFITNISNEPLSPTEKQNIKRNISHAQRKARNDLKDDGDIIIKPADKGGATMIMDKNYYQSEINKLLGNTDFYKQLDDDPYKKVKKEYEKLITNLILSNINV